MTEPSLKTISCRRYEDIETRSVSMKARGWSPRVACISGDVSDRHQRLYNLCTTKASFVSTGILELAMKQVLALWQLRPDTCRGGPHEASR